MRSNWILRTALVGMSLTLASFGVLGWAYAAGALEAPTTSLGAFIAGMHDKAGGLWILFLCACIGCVLAQILAACASVNFARLAKASFVWRALAFALYAVCVVFAAYSADRAGKFVLGSSHYAMYEAREEERANLQAEIAKHSATMDRASKRLAANTADTVTSRLNEGRLTFQAETSVAVTRLPEAQAELAAKPPLPRERAPGPEDGLVFAVFLVLALLEPWCYALAERGQIPKEAQPKRAKQAPVSKHPSVGPSVGDKVVAFGRRAAKAAGTAAAGMIAALPFFASPAPAEAAQPVLEPTTTSTVDATADGSSEFGPPVEPVTKSKRSRSAPPSLPPERAIELADEYARQNGGLFSSHALARVSGPSQSTIARSLMVARERGLLNDKPWARRWLKQRHHPQRSVA